MTQARNLPSRRYYRQAGALSRLRAQIETGTKFTADGKVPLEAGDRRRIEEEIRRLVEATRGTPQDFYTKKILATASEARRARHRGKLTR